MSFVRSNGNVTEMILKRLCLLYSYGSVAHMQISTEKWSQPSALACVLVCVCVQLIKLNGEITRIFYGMSNLLFLNGLAFCVENYGGQN